MLLEKILEDSYDVFTALSYKESLKKIDYLELNLILLDIMMPEPDGFEVCKKFKNSKKSANIPIIFLTAKTDVESIKHGFKVGAVDYITKPFNNEELFARIKNHIDLDLSKKQLEIELKKRQELEKKIIATIYNTEESERERFSREIHDGLGIILSSIKIYLNMIETGSLTKDEFNENIKYANELIIEAVTTAKEIANNIHPQILVRYGLIEALKIYFEKIVKLSKINISYNFEKIENRLDENIEIALFRIVNELTNNTLKHANASVINILLEKNDSKIILKYKDNGIGFDIKNTINSSGFGLNNILSRVKAFNGKCLIDSEVNQGMSVRIELKLSPLQ